MRRIAHLEELNKLRYSKEEDIIMLLSETQSIDNVRYRRQVIEYFDTVMEGKRIITMNTLDTAQTLLEFGTGSFLFGNMLGFSSPPNNKD
jgi:hypothetical protein